MENEFASEVNTSPALPAAERCRELVREREAAMGRPLRAAVVTFGCQMNARDSEKLKGVLKDAGYELTEDEDSADLIIFNTCTVRDSADKHMYGRLGNLVGSSRKRKDRIVGICGCMMQSEEAVAKVKKSYPFVKLIFGTHNLHAFPELLFKALSEGGKVVELEEKTSVLPEAMPVERKYPFKSGVNIMYGCDNFCTYCIVPYVRGREISRPAEDILDEVRRLAADGVREVMLLGQNVNSYGKKGDGSFPSFPGLLREVCRVDGIDRVRFMTSHPKDLSDELLQAMAEEEKVCRHLHLPVQSGSDRILKAMNRRYTSESYLKIVDKARALMPDISLTTDIIVAFPGESEEDFEDTLRLVDRVGYDSAFTFIYSKRTGTPAASAPGQIPPGAAHARFDRLLTLVQDRAKERCSRFVGQTLPVLVEEENREEGLMTGRTEYNILVHFPGGASDIGKVFPVKMNECRGFYYIGEKA